MKEKELPYFIDTLSSLKKAYQKLNNEVKVQDKSYKDLQKYMIDYKSELDKFEVYDYQQTLSMIDKQGYAHRWSLVFTELFQYVDDTAYIFHCLFQIDF